MKIAVIGAFDTKGEEYAFLVSELNRQGAETCTIDISTRGKPFFTPDYNARLVAEAGGSDLESLHSLTDRPAGMAIMSQGAIKIVEKLRTSGEIQGVIAMGGGQGTNMVIPIMRALPVGFPKLLLSTIAGLPAAAKDFSGINDTMIVNSLVDIAGLNDILRMDIIHCAGAIIGMADAEISRLSQPDHDTKKVAVTMWGVTTPAVDAVQGRLEEYGIESYAFHANGLGGEIMEKMIREGFFDGVIDLTLSEISNPVLGGDYAPDMGRMESAGVAGLPMVIIPGGIDMISVPPPIEKLPEAFQGRQYYQHNAFVLFARSTAEENSLLGKEIAKRILRSKGKTRVLLPMKGFSASDIEGGPLWNPEADAAFASSLKESLNSTVPVEEYDLHINDPAFAHAAADVMAELLGVSMK